MSESVSRRRWRVSLFAAVVAVAVGGTPGSALAHGVHEGFPFVADLSSPPVAVPEGREVPSLATAKSRTWIKENGAYETRVFGRAINVQDKDGVWRPIDNELRTVGDDFVNGEGNYDVELPQSLGTPLKFRDGASWLTLRLKGTDASGEVSGSTATYENAGTGVDATWTAFNEAIKEDLILQGPDSQTSFSYELGLSSGLKASERPDGGIDVTGADGDVAFSMPAAIAVDAKGIAAPPKAATISLDGDSLTVALDPEWVKAQGRAFPITLDPSVGTASSNDCSLEESDPAVSYCTDGTMYVGRLGAGFNHNAVMKFNPAAVVPAAAFVQSATIGVYSLAQFSASNPKTLHLKKVTSEWDDNASWTKRTATANWATPGGDLDASSESTLPAPANGQWAKFPATKLVGSWLDGSEPNRGVGVTDAGSTVNRAIGFASRDWSDSTMWPYLDVEYFPRAGQLSKYTIDSQQLTDRSSVGVNVAGGNLMISSSDLNVSAKGLPVSVNRVFNSQDVWDGQMGFKGRISIGKDIALYDCDTVGSKCLVGPTGFRARFAKNASGQFDTPPNVGNLTLTRATPTSGDYTLTDNGSGTKWTFFAAGFSWANRITDRHGNRIAFSFGGYNGDTLTQIKDANDRTYTVTAPTGQITEIKADFDATMKWTYGYTSGNLTSVTDPDLKTTSYAYTGTALTKITDPRGNETLITYDSLNRVTSLTRKIDGTVANDLTTTYSYPVLNDKCDETTGVRKVGVVGQTEIKDANGNRTNYCWDNGGGVLLVKNAQNKRADTKFAASTGNVEKLSDFAGTSSTLASTTTTYGQNGTSAYNATEVKSPAGETSSMTYKSGVNDPLDAYRVDVATDAQGKQTKYEYSGGNVTEVKQLSGANPSTVSMTWSGAAVTSSTDGSGNQTNYYYDAYQRLIEVRGPTFLLDGWTTYTYDTRSRVATMTDQRGKTTTFGYDLLGRQKTITDADGIVHTNTYDANGNLTARTGPSQTSTYVYDKVNRKTSETIIGTTTTYGYDKVGNLTSLNQAGSGGAVTYTYDTINRLATASSPPTFGSAATPDVTAYAYTDPNDPSNGTNPAAVITPGFVVQTLPGNGTVTTTQDLSGKPTEVLVKNSAGAQQLKREYKYRPRVSPGAQHEQLDWATEQGVAGSAVINKFYDYDGRGQVTGFITADASFNTLIDRTFTYDGAGNYVRGTHTEGGYTNHYSRGYNARNQLCWSTADQAANTACGTGSSPGTSPSPPASSNQWTYDKAGNMVTSPQPNLTWDAKSSLKTLSGATVTNLSPNNSELASIGTSTYKNTALGVTRITVGTDTSVIQRSPDDASAISQYRDGGKQWFVTDQIGSTTALISSSGNVLRTYDYRIDGYSTSNATPGTQPDTWIKYGGGHDIGNQLYHFGARYYQPVTRQWLQEDPLMQPGDLGQANRYAYVGNDPINATDPSGQFSLYKTFGRAARDVYEGGKVAVKTAAKRIPVVGLALCAGGAALYGGASYAKGSSARDTAIDAAAGCVGTAVAGPAGSAVKSKLNR